MRQVFVPGGQPHHTYVPRENHGLERRIRSASDNLCKLLTVTGPTKSGKSVLTKTVFPPSQSVWIDGGAITQEDDLWNEVVNQLDAYTTVEGSDQQTTTSGITAGIEASASIPFIAQGKAKLEPSLHQARSASHAGSRSRSPKTAAVQALRASRVPLVIDDFHYLDHETQGSVVRGLKGLVFDGHPVVLLAIPHRKYDAVRVEREMTGRVETVPIPAWNPDELKQIASLGFPLLKVTVDERLIDWFYAECLESPHLMQEFCRALCESYGIEETLETEASIPFDNARAEALFRAVAADTSKTVFERLAKGPRARSDRKQRDFKKGSTGDIYVAVLHAIARLRPGMVTLEYEQIRAELKNLLSGGLPQAHEVSRVLEHMSSIQFDESASAPVLDWDKKDRRLHITDPFFAFFLRWGLPDRSEGGLE